MLFFGRYRVLVQVVFWPVIWILVMTVMSGRMDGTSRIIQMSIPSILGMMIIVWMNLELFLPRFYFRKRILEFWLYSLIAFVVVIVVLNNPALPWVEWWNPRPRFREIQRNIEVLGEKFAPHRREPLIGFEYFRQIVPYLLALFGSTLIEVTRFANLKEKQAINLEKEKLATEIKFLKSQVNPHFLFNALHNIYTLSVIKSDLTSDSLLQLSEMLRYMIYDATESRVPLKKEISYIKNYVSLYELKDSKGMNVSLELDESRPELMVPPLIFIPFIENAFKHSKIEDRVKGYINIILKTTAQSVVLIVENSLPMTRYTKDDVGGVGLTNVKKRLELMYPGRHEMEIVSSETDYKIRLKIDLQ